MDKIPILIWTHRFNPNVGGVVVLHKLCHMLREKGEEAYLWIDNGNLSHGAVYSGYNTPIGNGFIDPKNAVVVYPEIISDDPLQAKVVVRWFLYAKPSLIPSPSDIVVHYAPQYYPNAEILNSLCILEIYPEHFDFKDQIVNRQGSCYTNRKGIDKARIQETATAQEINDSRIGNTIPLFRSKEVFYSYDTATMMSLQAAMCGCLSVVVPDEGVTANDYRKRMPAHKYGIAYGTSEEELEYAKKTKHLVKDYLTSLQEEGYRQIEVLLHRIKMAIRKL